MNEQEKAAIDELLRTTEVILEKIENIDCQLKKMNIYGESAKITLNKEAISLQGVKVNLKKTPM